MRSLFAIEGTPNDEANCERIVLATAWRFTRPGATLAVGPKPPTLEGVAQGTVAFWHGDDGWGAIKAPDRGGVGFAHFSHIRGVEGYRELFPGEAVEFEWADDYEQDGCQWRVAWVRPLGREAAGSPNRP